MIYRPLVVIPSWPQGGAEKSQFGENCEAWLGPVLNLGKHSWDFVI